LEKQQPVLSCQWSVEGNLLLSSESSSDNPHFEPQPGVSVESPAQIQYAADPFAPVSALPTAPPPVENPVWSGWDVLGIFGMAVASIFVLQIGLVLAYEWLRYPHATFFQVAQKVSEQPLLVILLQVLIYIPVAAFMFLLVEGKYHARFWQAIGWNWPRSQWKLLGLGAVMLIVLNLLGNLLPMPKDTPFEHFFDRPRDAYLLAILAVSVGPLMEELFFRGFLYPVLARRWGVGSGIFLSALPFALLHLQQYGYAWAVVLMIFVVGVVCGLVRAATRSVGASFLVHAGYNGTQMLIAIAFTRGFTHMPK
jgi:membrane protease YdiL (CAAX protease family)